MEHRCHLNVHLKFVDTKNESFSFHIGRQDTKKQGPTE